MVLFTVCVYAGIPVQAQSNDDNYAVFVSNRSLETIVSPRSCKLMKCNSVYTHACIMLYDSLKSD